MDDIYYQDVSYCALCDRYFPGVEARAAHVHFSSNHPQCEPCNRRFANKNALRNHYVLSPRHHYCRVCEKHFRSAAGFKVHVDYVHRGDSDEEDFNELDDEIDADDEDWEDNFGARHFPELANNGEVSSPPASDDEEVSPFDEYWDEDEDDDDDPEVDEIDDAYLGFAPTPSSARVSVTALTDYTSDPVPTSSIQDDQSYSEESDGNDADAESEDEDATPKRASLHRSKPAAKASATVAAAAAIFTCPLCLEQPTVCSATRCGHIFCAPCITTALNAKKFCPVCRETAGHKQLRKVFLPTATA